MFDICRYAQKVGYGITALHYTLEAIHKNRKVTTLALSILAFGATLAFCPKRVIHYAASCFPKGSPQFLSVSLASLATGAILSHILQFLSQKKLVTAIRDAIAKKIAHVDREDLDTACQTGTSQVIPKKFTAFRTKSLLISTYDPQDELLLLPKTKYSQEVYEILIDLFPSELFTNGILVKLWTNLLEQKNLPLGNALKAKNKIPSINESDHDNQWAGKLLTHLNNFLDCFPQDAEIRKKFAKIFVESFQQDKEDALLKMVQAHSNDHNFGTLEGFLKSISTSLDTDVEKLTESFTAFPDDCMGCGSNCNHKTNIRESMLQILEKGKKTKADYSISADVLAKKATKKEPELYNFLLDTDPIKAEMKIPSIRYAVWTEIAGKKQGRWTEIDGKKLKNKEDPTNYEIALREKKLFPGFEDSDSDMADPLFQKLNTLANQKPVEKNKDYVKTLIDLFGKEKFKKVFDQKKGQDLLYCLLLDNLLTNSIFTEDSK